MLFPSLESPRLLRKLQEGRSAVLGSQGTQVCVHCTATGPSVTPQPSLPWGPSSRASCSLPCGERDAGGPGVRVPGPGPHPCPCPPPRVSTRPRGPQEMAVLCHGRCPLLTQGHGHRRGHPGPCGEASQASLQVPVLSPCPRPWLGMETAAGGLCPPSAPGWVPASPSAG